MYTSHVDFGEQQIRALDYMFPSERGRWIAAGSCLAVAAALVFTLVSIDGSGSSEVTPTTVNPPVELPRDD